MSEEFEEATVLLTKLIALVASVKFGLLDGVCR